MTWTGTAIEGASPADVESLANEMPEVIRLEKPKARGRAKAIEIDPKNSYNTNDHGASRVPEKDGAPVLDAARYAAYLDTVNFAELYAAGAIHFAADPEPEKEQFPIGVSEKTDLWYRRYARVMPMLAWGGTKISWENLGEGPGAFKMDEEIRRLMEHNGSTHREIEAYRRFLDDARRAYKKDRPSIRRFGIDPADSGKGEFKFCAPNADEQGAVAAKVFYVSVAASVKINRILFFEFPRESSRIHAGVNEMVLNWSVYKKKQQWIEDAVSGHRPEAVRA